MRFILLFSFCLSVLIASAQDSTDRFTLHLQTTIINQNKPGFSAPYSGPHSLSTAFESKTSATMTIYTGVRIGKLGGFHFDPEFTAGSGLSSVLGIADATNGETFRIGSPKPKAYIARLYYRQLIQIDTNTTNQESDQNQFKGRFPTNYWAFTVGKINMGDFFDKNNLSHDPRTQFMSWGLMDQGSWDYPANTRGYSPSIVIERIHPKWELKAAISLLPTVANGNVMNWNVQKSNSITLEGSRMYSLKGKKGCIRMLAFLSTTYMSNYNDAIRNQPINPVLEAVRVYGHTKYGVHFNIEQGISDHWSGFMRVGMNDGNNETWAFTPIDQSASIGFVNVHPFQNRPDDRFGMAVVVSGLSKPHRAYLAAGGTDFMLGDGRLKYTHEKLFETYYSISLRSFLKLSATYQFIVDPAFNADRKGPVNVASVRVHVQI